METINNKLVLGGVSCEDLATEFGTPLFVYEEDVIRGRIRALREAITYDKTGILYACKANANLAVIRIAEQEGCQIDAVSPGEVFMAKKAGFSPDRIHFTGNNVTDDEMRYVHDQGVAINVDSLEQLERFGKMFPGEAVGMRINPDVGGGHHDHCITGGPDSKFGIYFDRMEEARHIASQHGLRIRGVHQHIGSGILDPALFKIAMKVILDVAKAIPGLEYIDFGGGIGVPYAPDEEHIDVPELGKAITNGFEAFCAEYGSRPNLYVEPGRYLVCEAGFLLARCNTLKETPKHKFAGTDSGFNHLIRHPMYGSYHAIANASNVEDEKIQYAVAGNICESGDLFTHGRQISRISVGDIIAVLNAGAYGYAMSSNYNSRPRPAEVIVKDGQARLVRQRETFEDLLKGQE
ncbi:diaminopimelate decarboxylase [Candidatus Hydrogenedentota bacterium]